MATEGQKVVVTTEYRGVFFGELAERNGRTVTLRNCRNCVYWARSLKGFLGLASSGPNSGCRIGPAAESVELFGVTSITVCTPEAVLAWEVGPWN